MFFPVRITRFANGAPVATQEISKENLIKRALTYAIEGNGELYDPTKAVYYSRRLGEWKKLNTMLDSLHDITGNPRSDS